MNDDKTCHSFFLPTGTKSIMVVHPPLLSQEEVPNLGGTQGVELEQSPLERLIQQSTSEQQEAPSGPFFFEEIINTASSFHTSPQTSNNNACSSFITLISGSLCLFQMGFLWGSFLSEEWFETRLLISIDWQKQFLPSLDGSTNQLLHTTSLASLLSVFLGADLHWAAVCLVLVSLVMPCLSMILCAAWTVGDYQNSKKEGINYPRKCFEYLLRLSLLTFLALTVLDVATSSIDMVGNNTDLQITNRPKGGLVCYTLGIISALTIIGVLKVIRPDPCMSSIATTNNNSNSRSVPPNHAFQQLPRQTTLPEQQQPLLMHDDWEEYVHVETSTETRASPQASSRELSFCQKFILYEIGLCSALLLLPAYFLPIFHIEFTGLASEFMTNTSATFEFWEFPVILKGRALLAETEHSMVVALGTVLLTTVYILPAVATFLAIYAWKVEPGMSRLFKNALRIIQPCLCGIVFAGSVLISVPTFGRIGKTVLEKKTSGICKQFHMVTSDSCLTIDGELGLGAWFLLAQSIALEILVIITLCWKQ
jgi:hypothetical protein